jgi:hypothetical protein
MRLIAAALIVVLTAGSLGCVRVVRHRYDPNQPTGVSVPVEVTVPYKTGDDIRGTVHYRLSGKGRYESLTMQTRGGQLWAMLPTESYAAAESVEYYIDFSRNGEFTGLGSPGSPYRIKFLDKRDYILANLVDESSSTDADHPVAIHLYAAGQPVHRPVVHYQMPGVPGEVRAPMESDGYGNFHLVIPAAAVAPGVWRYAIEMNVSEQTHRMPPQGYRSFSVTIPVPAPVTAEVPVQ